MNNLEIERKFLVSGDYKSFAFAQQRIVQAYIVPNYEGRSVRVRIKGDKGYITIKGASSESGMSRFEWEKEIPITEAEQLLQLAVKGKIEKTRYLIKAGNYIFEVDEFYGDNAGLIVAEIELTSEADTFEKPEWLGKEVTGDNRYYNSQLISNPYKDWKV